MKKIWQDPTMESLAITATAGGTRHPEIEDHIAYWDADLGMWISEEGDDPISL